MNVRTSTVCLVAAVLVLSTESVAFCDNYGTTKENNWRTRLNASQATGRCAGRWERSAPAWQRSIAWGLGGVAILSGGLAPALVGVALWLEEGISIAIDFDMETNHRRCFDTRCARVPQETVFLTWREFTEWIDTTKSAYPSLDEFETGWVVTACWDYRRNIRMNGYECETPDCFQPYEKLF